MTNETPPIENLSHDELVLRVLYALLRPAVRLGAAFDVPLKELVRLLESAHFQEVRSRASTLKDAAERLGISERSAERLSRQARETFVLPDIRHHLPRRVEFILSASPMSLARLVQVLPDVEEGDVLAALTQLREEGRVTENIDRTITYHVSSTVRSLPRDSWVARVGGLTSFGENLANAAWGRFFVNDAASFARTLSFRISPERLADMSKWYAEQILPQIVQWNQEAESEDTDATLQPMQLSLCWAPYEAMDRTRAPEGE